MKKLTTLLLALNLLTQAPRTQAGEVHNWLISEATLHILFVAAGLNTGLVDSVYQYFRRKLPLAETTDEIRSTARAISNIWEENLNFYPPTVAPRLDLTFADGTRPGFLARNSWPFSVSDYERILAICPLFSEMLPQFTVESVEGMDVFRLDNLNDAVVVHPDFLNESYELILFAASDRISKENTRDSFYRFPLHLQKKVLRDLGKLDLLSIRSGKVYLKTKNGEVLLIECTGATGRPDELNLLAYVYTKETKKAIAYHKRATEQTHRENTSALALGDFYYHEAKTQTNEKLAQKNYNLAYTYYLQASGLLCPLALKGVLSLWKDNQITSQQASAAFLKFITELRLHTSAMSKVLASHGTRDSRWLGYPETTRTLLDLRSRDGFYPVMNIRAHFYMEACFDYQFMNRADALAAFASAALLGHPSAEEQVFEIARTLTLYELCLKWGDLDKAMKALIVATKLGGTRAKKKLNDIRTSTEAPGTQMGKLKTLYPQQLKEVEKDYRDIGPGKPFDSNVLYFSVLTLKEHIATTLDLSRTTVAALEKRLNAFFQMLTDAHSPFAEEDPAFELYVPSPVSEEVSVQTTSTTTTTTTTTTTQLPETVTPETFEPVHEEEVLDEGLQIAIEASLQDLAIAEATPAEEHQDEPKEEKAEESHTRSREEHSQKPSRISKWKQKTVDKGKKFLGLSSGKKDSDEDDTASEKKKDKSSSKSSSSRALSLMPSIPMPRIRLNSHLGNILSTIQQFPLVRLYRAFSEHDILASLWDLQQQGIISTNVIQTGTGYSFSDNKVRATLLDGTTEPPSFTAHTGAKNGNEWNFRRGIVRDYFNFMRLAGQRVLLEQAQAQPKQTTQDAKDKDSQ